MDADEAGYAAAASGGLSGSVHGCSCSWNFSLRTSKSKGVERHLVQEAEKTFQNPRRWPTGERVVTIKAGYAAAASGGHVGGAQLLFGLEFQYQDFVKQRGGATSASRG